MNWTRVIRGDGLLRTDVDVPRRMKLRRHDGPSDGLRSRGTVVRPPASVHRVVNRHLRQTQRMCICICGWHHLWAITRKTRRRKWSYWNFIKIIKFEPSIFWIKHLWLLYLYKIKVFIPMNLWKKNRIWLSLVYRREIFWVNLGQIPCIIQLKCIKLVDARFW